MQVQAEDITDLTIETVTFDNGNPGLSAVEEAVNQITIPAIGVRIHLLDVGIQQHAQRISMMIESGEPVDLVMAGVALPGGRHGNMLRPRLWCGGGCRCRWSAW